VDVLLGSSVHSEAAQPFGERIVLRDEHAAVAVSTEVLRWEEAERADRRDFTRHAPLAIDHPPGADRLRGVLDDRKPGHRSGNRLQRRHLAEQIDRDHGLRPPRAGPGDGIRADVERVRLDVDEHGRRTDVVDRSRRREERERRRDHLVAPPHVECSQRKQQRVGATRAPDGVPRVRQLGQRSLECGDRLAEDEQLRIHHAHRGRDDIVADRGVLGLEVEQGNGHACL
jgi:hypothetical protein